MAAGICLLFVVCLPDQLPEALAGVPLTEAQQEALDFAKALQKEGHELLYGTGDPDGALTLLTEAFGLLAGGEVLEHRNRGAKIALSIGAAHLRLGDPDAATEWFERGLTTARQTGKSPTIVTAQVHLVRLDIAADRFDEAFRRLEEAKAEADLSGSAALQGMVHFELGATHQQRSDLAPALEEYFETLDRLAPEVAYAPGERPTNGPRFYVAARARIAGIFSALGHHDLAWAEYQAVLALPDLIAPHDATAILASAADVAAEAGHRDEAAILLDEAWASFEQFGPAEAEPRLVWMKARLAEVAAPGDPAPCAGMAEAATLADSLGQTGSVRSMQLDRSECLLEAGDLAGAFAAAGLARAMDERAGTDEGWRSWWSLARIRSAMGRPDAADAYLEAIAGLDAQIATLDLDALALGLEAAGEGLYDDAADALLLQGRVEEALFALERSRSRLLLASLLGLPGAARSRGGLPADELAPTAPAPREAGARIVRGGTVLRSLREGTWDPAMVAIQAGVEPTSEDAARLLRDQVTPGDRRLVGAEAVSVDVIRSRLPQGVAAVSYRVAPGHTDVFVTRRSGTTHARLAAGQATVEPLVRRIVRSMSAAAPGPGDLAVLVPAAQEAFDLLWAPIADQTADARVVLVVPDGVLYPLPFTSLHDGTGWLVERQAIAIAPSLNIADALLQRAPRERARFLGIADPLGDHPAAAAEVQQASERWDHAEILAGGAATPGAFVRALGTADVVHVAAHGQLLSRTAPSYLELASAGGGAAALDSDAILQLRVTASLVTLSACKSARGGARGGRSPRQQPRPQLPRGGGLDGRGLAVGRRRRGHSGPDGGLLRPPPCGGLGRRGPRRLPAGPDP